MSLPAPAAPPRVWWPASGLILLVVAATLVTRADADLWGHVRFGIDILESWRLPVDDPYSFTQDKPWVNHEWLSELLMGAAWLLGGARGLVVLKGLMLSATLFVIWTAFRRARLSVQLGALLVLVAGSLHMTSPLRPQLWTYLCLAILCRLLVSGSLRARRVLPLVFVVWANSHGGWVVGCGVLLAWAVGESWERRDVGRQWLWLVLACVAATLVTPYGWTLWHFVATTVRPTREIAEWMPLWQLDPWFWLPWGLGVVVAAWALWQPGERRVARALVLAMLALGGLRVLRIGPLFLEAALISSGALLARRWPAQPMQRASRGVAELVAGLVLVVGPLLVAVRLATFALACIPPFPRSAIDPQMARSLARAEDGRLVTYFDWGQYALWHLGPRLKVSMDGRRETIYSDARLEEHQDVLYGRENGLAALAAWRAEYVWLPTFNGSTRRWLSENGYRIDITADDAFVAVRADLPVLSVSERATSPRRCFPD